MQKTHDIEIDESGDIFKNDLLDRESEIENLTPMVLNFNDPLVLALDSPWGAGKTTFVKLWQAYLKKEDKQAIYFNAWETDFAEDPLIVLVSELNKWVKNSGNSLLIKTWKDNIGKTLPNILKRAAVAGTKAATFGALDLDKQAEGVIADLSGGIASDLLEHFDKQSKSIEQFKDAIKEVLEILPSDQKNLVIFIDELDRCRPTYAIELLERIKHLFNIEHLVFVLSTDTHQLSHSIKAVYGNDFDAKNYLKRFIDLDYSLKTPNIKNYIVSQLKYLKINEYFKDRIKINNSFRYDEENFTESLFFLIARFQLKLRDINFLLMRIRLILYSVPTNNYLYDCPLITLLMLREYNKELYTQYIDSPIIANKVIEYMLPEVSKETENNYHAVIVAHLIAPNEKEDFEFLVNPYKEVIKDSNRYDFNGRVCEIASNLRGGFGEKSFSKRSLDLIAERIELFHQITL